jgi:hypothetical protein
MARHAPIRFLDKVRLVKKAVEIARGSDRGHFDFTREVAPGVKLVLREVEHTPIVFALWTQPTDIAELCGDAAYPATAGLLSIDKEQAHEVLGKGILIDLSQFVRSDSTPGTYYVLFDYLSAQQVTRVLQRLVPALSGQRVAA